jgi:hypothetical protein
MEFCTPGALDVVKDSINPMYMPMSAYDRFLKTRGHDADEYTWRSTEFVRFKSGMDNNLEQGVEFREVLSLKRLNDIAQRGLCRMAGLYFMERGYIELDAEGCAAILKGYRNLEKCQLYDVILDDLSGQRDNCWQSSGDHIASTRSGPNRDDLLDQPYAARNRAHFDACGQGAGGNRTELM